MGKIGEKLKVIRVFQDENNVIWEARICVFIKDVNGYEEYVQKDEFEEYGPLIMLIMSHGSMIVKLSFDEFDKLHDQWMKERGEKPITLAN